MKQARLSQIWQLYALLAFPFVIIFLFSYLPMLGLVISFQEYSIFRGVFGSEWVGFDVFREVFRMKAFWSAFANTITLNGLSLIIGFPAPLLLALLLNEVRNRRVKKFFQSTLYLPYFLSWAIIGSMSLQLLSDNTGLVNIAIRAMGGETIPFLSDGFHWIFTYQAISVWQGAGWGTIVYLAAMTGINPELYEAAEVDGAGRFGKVWHITLPGIVPTIIILLILRVGRIVSIGFEQPFILGNDLVRDVSQVISTFVYTLGIKAGRFNIGTAVGLFQSVTGLVFLLGANAIAKKYSDTGIW